MRYSKTTLAVVLSGLVLGAGMLLLAAPALGALGRVELPFSPFGVFSRATGVAVDESDGNVFVADSAANVVRVFGAAGGSPAGGMAAVLDGTSTPTGSFDFDSEPVGVAVDNACYQRGLSGAACSAFDPSDGDIYVTDIGHNVVDKFRVNGSGGYEYVSQFTGYNGEVTFHEPVGVAVDREGNVYIVDYGHNDVDEFSSAGAPVRRMATPSEPQDVTVDAKGDIYIRKFAVNHGTSEMELERGSLTGPVEHEVNNAHEGTTGLAADAATGRVLIGFGSQIGEFDEAGVQQADFGGEALSEARGVAVDEASDEVYVVDGASDRVRAFGPPVVVLASATTGPVSATGRASATVTGTVDPESKTLAASCVVQYGKTGALGSSAPCSPAGASEPGKVGTGEEPVPVSATLKGLEADVVYYYRIVAINTNGPNPASEATLETTQPAVTGVQTGEATAVGKTTATLNGTVEPEGIATHYYYEYGETPGYGSTSPLLPAEEAAVASTPTVLSGLHANTTYYYRLVAVNEFGETKAEEGRSLTTVPNEPAVVSESATRIFPREALLAAVVVPEGSSTSYHFLYGPTASYGSSAPVSDIALGSGEAGLQALLSISGLQPGTTYHYAIVASNRGGSTTGPDATFTTPSATVPVVSTGAASEVSQNAASLSGTVDPQGAPTSYEWDLGTDTTYGTRISGEAGSSNEPQALALHLLGLAAGTLYHYRLVATNTYGTVYGPDQTFLTPGYPTALLVSPVGAPLVPSPVFGAPSIGGAITVSQTPSKAKHRTKTRAKTKVKAKAKRKRARGRKAVDGARKASRALRGERGGNGR
jgi:phosphodiesterase/alkaline phosphatase D-like protein